MPNNVTEWFGDVGYRNWVIVGVRTVKNDNPFYLNNVTRFWPDWVESYDWR
jgi:hypothetical protein